MRHYWTCLSGKLPPQLISLDPSFAFSHYQFFLEFLLERRASLMRCLYGCRSIKPHVLSCWEMNYSFFLRFLLRLQLISFFFSCIAWRWQLPRSWNSRLLCISKLQFLTRHLSHTQLELDYSKDEQKRSSSNFPHSHFLIDWDWVKPGKKPVKYYRIPHKNLPKLGQII